MSSFTLRVKVALCAALLLPVVFTYFALAQQMRAVPIYDDYAALLGFGVTFHALPSAWQKLAWVIASQHGNYKLIVEHSLEALDIAFTGRLHLAFLIWCGNLLPLGIGLTLWKMFFREEPNPWRRLLLFLPIVYLLAQLNYVENLDWAMCGLQTFPVVLFSLLALTLLPEQKAVGLSCIFAVLACFSSANGFLLAPFGLVAYRSRLRPLIAWLASFAVALAAYLYRYTPKSTPQVSLLERSAFFISFLGSAFENQHRTPIRGGAIVAGVVLLSIFGRACYERFFRSSPAAFYAASWVILTAAIVSDGRAYLTLPVSLTMRYRLYSDLFLAFCYGFLATKATHLEMSEVRRRMLYAVALCCAVCMSAFSDVKGYKYLIHRRERVEYGIARYKADPRISPEVSNTGDIIPGNFTEDSRRYLNAAISSGIYQLP